MLNPTCDYVILHLVNQVQDSKITKVLEGNQVTDQLTSQLINQLTKQLTNQLTNQLTKTSINLVLVVTLTII